MRTLKIYLDTSVISHLDAPDAPDKMRDTLKLWEAIKQGEYEACISALVLQEIGHCFEPKQSVMREAIFGITLLEETTEVDALASRYIVSGILGQKNKADCVHIAFACVYNCDIIVSWNFKHLVNVKTISGVKGVNALEGYREMPIYTPTMLIDVEE
jgi:predicted nucleic acid-binding protein